MSEVERAEVLGGLSDEESHAVLFDWEVWARTNQLPPEGDWSVWAVLAGRGFGKSRTGAEFVRGKVERGEWRRIGLVARTAADVRDVMVEGESGILTISPPWFRPLYEPARRRLTWPNGAIATTYSAQEPDVLRGPQHEGAWCDEVASWRYEGAWDNLQLGLRGGVARGVTPQTVVTTTPKAVKLLRRILAMNRTVVTKGSTYDNEENLPQTFLDQIVGQYEGTRLGRQEIYAELLEDAEGALWRRAWLEEFRVTEHPSLRRLVVAIDPAASDNPDSSETGIIVAGLGDDGRGYVLDDLSLHGSPRGWASEAVTGYHKYEANMVIGEANNGGDMVAHTVATVDPNVPFKKVFASRGKHTRAEPVSALYEQGRVSHVGLFAELEDQLCTWEPGDRSPDRLDALVWALTELMVSPEPETQVFEMDDPYVISDY